MQPAFNPNHRGNMAKSPSPVSYPNLSSAMPNAPFSSSSLTPNAPGFVGGQAEMPTSKIELTISCRNLSNRDILSLSDPFCLLLIKDSWQEKFYEIGRTETIQDSLNPEWVKKFIINYNFETVQQMRFEIWDYDTNGHDFLGYHEATLGEIVSITSQQYIQPLEGYRNKKQASEIVIVTEELSTCKQIVKMRFLAENMPRSYFSFLRSNQFLVISRSNEDSSYSVVIKTESVPPSKSFGWKPIIIRVQALCNGDYDRSIKLDCYKEHSNGRHELIGTCYTSLRELTSAGFSSFSENSKKFPFEAPNGQHSNSESNGTLILGEIALTEEITFIDYIKSGTQMHFAVAIDFTASNGPPSDPQSLHFLNTMNNKPNAYVIALRAVGEIIQQYDSSGMFPAFGFGARLPPNGEVSHQFPLNGNASHPYCSGISEILTHYRNCLSSVTLYGPTNFSPVIQNTASIAAKFQDGKHYFVLLIITDGIISDMRQTKNAIIEASRLPISIIIVGVGNANFAAMKELDSDDHRLSANGRHAQRDIVQFVPLNKFLSHNGPFVRSQADLAREVLAEIPEQLTVYMKKRGFLPLPPSNAPQL